MANPTIGATTPRIQYTATGGQTAFTVPFEFLANADLAVYVNGTLQTLTTHYTLTGANTTGGGTCTFVSGRTAGDIVTIIGNLAYSRSTNKYTKFGLLPAEVLEADFDALQVQAKQLALADQFALRLPMTDSGAAPSALPGKTARANTLLGFDANGAATIIQSAANDVSTAISAAQAAQAAAEAAQALAEAAKTAAQLAETNAETAETNAELAETNAEIAEANAEAAQAAAELARDSSWVNNRIFANTAAGISGTSNGQYFSVPSANSKEHLILYLNNSGIANEIKRYPSTELIEPIILAAPSGYQWSVTDQDGRMALGITSTGVTVASNLQPVSFEAGEIGITSSNMTIRYPAPYGYQLALIDQDGRMAFGVTSTGETKTSDLFANTLNGVSVQSIITPDPAAADLGNQNFSADIVHVLSYGQSLSVGIGTGSTPLTTSQRFDNLKFVGGVRAQDAGTNTTLKYGSLVALTETSGGEEGACETPIGGATDMVKERIASENGIIYTQQSYQILGSAPGKGAQTIAQLSKPGTLYTRFMDDVTYGYTRAQALNKTYKVPAFFWTQGESDGATTNYASLLSTLRGNINTDVKAITGQTEDVWCICYQIARPAQALRFNAAMELDSKIRIATPVYHLPTSDTVHFTATSSKVYGAYLGLAYKRLVIDGHDWKPMMPLSTVRQGTVLNIKFNHHGTGMVFDTTTVPNQVNYGFRLYDASNNEITINSVTITQWDTIRIVAATSIPSGSKLRYGFTDPTISGAGFAKGNLRDNAGATLIFDGGGINYAMHNWCILFELTL